MKNKELWKPTKFVKKKYGYRASRDLGEVFIGSRFIIDLVATTYEKALRKHASGMLLDVGCGKVPLYEIYKPYISDNICIDWADTTGKDLHLDYSFDLNQGIPLPDNSFDTILATDVLEHISNPDLLWRDMTRILKQDGKIIICLPFFFWIHEAPYDFYRYTEYRLRKYCDENKMEVISLEPYGGTMEIIFDIVSKHLYFSKILSKIHLFFSKAFTKSSIGKLVFNKTSRKFPLGYCLIAQKL